MRVKQYVMAYRADHEKIKSLHSPGYESLRPVLRINVEIHSPGTPEESLRIEFNTPVIAHGKRGWLNLNLWESADTFIAYQDTKPRNTRTFFTPFLAIAYTPLGREGGCPAENDNDGCFYLNGEEFTFIPAESIRQHKEYCDCQFQWTNPFTEAMTIPCQEVLGAYWVEFERKREA